MNDSGAHSKLGQRQFGQTQTRDCDLHEFADIKSNTRDAAMDKASESLKALLDQQEYEDLRNTSWADLMEQEMIKSRTDSSSEEKCPNLSDAIKQSHVEQRKTSTWKKRQGTKPSFKCHIELTPTDQLPHAVKRDKMQRTRVLSAVSTDDERSASSKIWKKRRGDSYVEKIACEASSSRFDSEDSPRSLTRSFSAESGDSCNAPGSSSGIASTLHIKKGWSEPKLGWCRNETILLRRSKEIEKTKAKPIYAKYLAQVPRYARTKDMPKTPNKYIQYSRRSWDKQVRLWKRRLYEWAGEESTQSCLGSNESTGDEIL